MPQECAHGAHKSIVCSAKISSLRVLCDLLFNHFCASLIVNRAGTIREEIAQSQNLNLHGLRLLPQRSGSFAGEQAFSLT